MAKWSELIQGILVRHVRLFGRESDGLDYQAGVDRVNHGLKMMDAVHANTHAGIVFEAQHEGAAVTAGASIEMLIQLNARYPVHCKPFSKSEGPSELFLFEQPTFSAAGTAVTSYNRNRRAFAGAANTVVTHTPTTSNDGTQLTSSPVYSPSGPGQTSAGGDTGGFSEWILREGYSYLLRLTNTHTVLAFDMWMGLVFYEQELKL